MKQTEKNRDRSATQWGLPVGTMMDMFNNLLEGDPS